MTPVKGREIRIKLCALKVRYRQAWLRKATSCELAALLSDIEVLERIQNNANPDNVLQQVEAQHLHSIFN